MTPNIETSVPVPHRYLVRKELMCSSYIQAYGCTKPRYLLSQIIQKTDNISSTQSCFKTQFIYSQLSLVRIERSVSKREFNAKTESSVSRNREKDNVRTLFLSNRWICSHPGINFVYSYILSLLVFEYNLCRSKIPTRTATAA